MGNGRGPAPPQLPEELLLQAANPPWPIISPGKELTGETRGGESR